MQPFVFLLHTIGVARLLDIATVFLALEPLTEDERERKSRRPKLQTTAIELLIAVEGGLP
uniref:Uncharacterized protein n=1 Tax=Oryza sativa subsp. japonica TaxID=39947 RepID=Q5Z8K2_ORYSJ|nr:hypothetical protein [Oryza sativa Japonica Group]